jgi:restriction endonuclease Mrr|tara:strand:+ start:150 stop:527 length:378 start_codon:yes stop_codon:yes gene_type:complete
MADFYTNLPAKDKDNLEKTIEKLTTSAYEEEFQFNAGEYDAAVAFFVKRGFKRQAAESTAYVILAQAKIDSMRPQEILDQLTYASPAQLSELITIILNANRYKSSRLGVRQNLTTKETVSRNIID